MKILIAGWGIVALGVLEQLVNAYKVQSENIFVLTYDNSDNVLLVDFLEKNNIRFDFRACNNESLINEVAIFSPDYIISAYYKNIIPSSLITLAKISAINIHPSLLPKYKGCFSAPWAIISGEKEAGITFHRMDSRVDEGDIYWQKRIDITKDDTGYSLYHRLCIEAIREFNIFFDKMVSGQLIPIPMPSGGGYFPRKVPHSGIINPEWSNERIDCFIRGIFFPPFRAAIFIHKGIEYEVTSLSQYKNLQQSLVS